MGTIYQRISWVTARRWNRHKTMASDCLCSIIGEDSHFLGFWVKAMCVDNMHTTNSAIRVFLHDS